MNIYTYNKFEKGFKKLTSEIKDLVEQKIEIFKKDPFDPRLKTHKLHGKLEYCWAFSINHSCRIIFEFSPNNDVWLLSIGNHDIYE